MQTGESGDQGGNGGGEQLSSDQEQTGDAATERSQGNKEINGVGS